MKTKTNKQRLKSLFKELENTPYEIGLVLLRERLITIAKISKEGIKENPEHWDNPFVSSYTYLEFCDRVLNHLDAKE